MKLISLSLLSTAAVVTGSAMHGHSGCTTSGHDEADHQYPTVDNAAALLNDSQREEYEAEVEIANGMSDAELKQINDAFKNDMEELEAAAALSREEGPAPCGSEEELVEEITEELEAAAAAAAATSSGEEGPAPCGSEKELVEEITEELEATATSTSSGNVGPAPCDPASAPTGDDETMMNLAHALEQEFSEFDVEKVMQFADALEKEFPEFCAKEIFGEFSDSEIRIHAWTEMEMVMLKIYQKSSPSEQASMVEKLLEIIEQAGREAEREAEQEKIIVTGYTSKHLRA